MADHTEHHLVQRMGWLRAAVLGANDGIISTSSLILGVSSAAAGAADHHQVLIAGLAGLVAGAMSMAAGEYVSVSSQSDTEQADLARETAELRDDPDRELAELAHIYVQRGIEPAVAHQVATQLMAHNALEAHARDELGISDATAARPIQAALASAASFTAGAAGPLMLVFFSPAALIFPIVAGGSLILLGALGIVGAIIGGAGVIRPTLRVMFWGALAMALTTGIGVLVGKAV
jgi:VIT1/CCC1 family predicted Fe2+/Mn2+ transporter